MLALLPDGSLVGALQAGASEGAPDQRVLVTRSHDGGSTWAPAWLARNSSSGNAQWSPVLFQDPATAGPLWLFYSESAARSGDPMLLYATTSRDQGQSWSSPALVASAAAVGGNVLWAVNKMVLLPDGSWLLPCDTLRPNGNASAALALLSQDQGSTWSAHGNMEVHNDTYPEPAMALVNRSAAGGPALVAILRGPGVGLYQATGAPSGEAWSTPVPMPLAGASSKPALWAASPSLLLLSYNLETRATLLLAASRDQGASYQTWATLETGSLAACYPTIITVGSRVLVAYTVYGPTPQRRTGIRVAILDLPPAVP
jgi:predicted neuraminidase